MKKDKIIYELRDFNKGKAFVNIIYPGKKGAEQVIKFCIDKNCNYLFSLKPEFTAVEYEDEDVAIVECNGKFALMDNHGVLLTDFIYDRIYGGAENGLFEVIRNGLHGHIDIRGKEIIPCMYEIGNYFSEGVASEKLNGKWGMIDYYNNIVIPFEYDDLVISYNNLIMANKGGKWGLIDKSNTKIVDFIYDDILIGGTRNCIAFGAEKDGNYGLIDRDGNVVEEFIYDDILYLVDCDGMDGELLAICKNDRYALYSATQATFLTDFDYASIEYSNEFMFKFRKDKKFGFMDKYGNELIPDIYDIVCSFNEGYACVKKDGGFGLINHGNQLVVPTEYQLSLRMCSGRIEVTHKNGESGYIDCNNNLIIPYGKYIFCKDFQNGVAIVYSKEKGHNIYIDTNGDEIGDVYIDNVFKKTDGTKEELGSWTEEMLKPENLIGPFNTVEELMAATWDADDTDTDENQHEDKIQEPGSWTKEMTKPENLDPRVFYSADEVMDATWDEDESDTDENHHEDELEELGSWTKEMTKPENVIGPFDSTEELMKKLWDED